MSWLDLESLRVRGRYSQRAEHAILCRIFDAIGTTNRFVVDIGAGDGGQRSNVRELLDSGWSGVLLDACYGNDLVQQAWVSCDNVNSILDHHRVPTEFDLLSLDIDGQDYWVLQAMNRRPRVMVVEFNPIWDRTQRKSVPKNVDFRWSGKDDYYGASIGAFEALGQSRGYRLVHHNYLNLFFVLDVLIPKDALVDVPFNLLPDSQRGWPANTDAVWVDV